MAVSFFVLCAVNQSLSATFEFTSSDGKGSVTFIAKTREERVIRDVRTELAKPFAKRSKHIIGPVTLGDEGYNKPWHWHFVRDKWSLTELSMELCDATPSYLESHLDEWLTQVGTFCPWNSRVSREIEMTFP